MSMHACTPKQQQQHYHIFCDVLVHNKEGRKTRKGGRETWKKKKKKARVSSHKISMQGQS